MNDFKAGVLYGFIWKTKPTKNTFFSILSMIFAFYR